MNKHFFFVKYKCKCYRLKIGNREEEDLCMLLSNFEKSSFNEERSRTWIMDLQAQIQNLDEFFVNRFDDIVFHHICYLVIVIVHIF